MKVCGEAFVKEL